MVIFSVSLPSTEALSFGGSKLFQIVTPLLFYMVLQETPGFSRVLPSLIQRIHPQANVRRWDNIFRMLLGFTAWKIGCDFGFLIVNTGAAPWSIAFTLAGLIPYAVGMYIVYYLIGTKIIIQGQLNPFQEQYVPSKIKGRPSAGRQFLSKFFHESLNTTSANVPLRQVLIKPFIDYGAILITWPLYNVALLFSQSGEINFAPMIYFSFVPILVFYIVNVMGFILGFNLGELIYFRIHFLIESIKVKSRKFLQAKKIKDLWTMFDVNGDGSISADELRVVMRSLGQDPGNHELTYLFSRVDIDCSGSIDYDEFISFICSDKRNQLSSLLRQKSSLGMLDQIWEFLVIQWQTIKSNTAYIRAQGFLRRYGLNNRWLLSGGLGLIFIILLEPTIARFLFSWSNQLQNLWFYRFGHMDPTHLAQISQVFTDVKLPQPEPLTIEFPTQLADLYSDQPENLISFRDVESGFQE
ncbi:MAG: EF-hand domain-containing protein [Synechococcaceae cyanobacterium SM2_3_1]|nr:EF-hand domain-containing protein [Synechococcaceae cyanobacterium SM2_3_1]